MKLTLENTTQMVEVNGIPARVWDGITEGGVRVQCLIIRVAVHKSDDNSAFERELTEHPPKRPEGQRAFDARLIL